MTRTNSSQCKIRSCLILFLSAAFNTIWAQPVSTSQDSAIAGYMSQISSSNIQTYIEDLADAGGHETRTSFTQGNRWSVDYIKSAFDSFQGLDSVELDTFFVQADFPFNTQPLFNVVATLEGETDSYYIVGGHLDATANLDGNLNWEIDWPTAKAQGADDNASGIAAILEIARVLSDPANGFDSNFGIKFIAFGAEERHPIYNNNNHLGARHYVQNAYQNGDDILGVYILDMVGYNGTDSLYFNIVSNNTSRPLGEKMLEVNSAFNIGLSSNQVPFPEATYSDHDQFWLYRYKAILIIENAPPWENALPYYRANPYYHRETDSPATVNIEQVLRVAQLTLGTVASYASDVTSVEQPVQTSLEPRSFVLLQNYPNPFNAGTTIRFQLLFDGEVELNIINTRGEIVKALAYESKPAGEYSYNWDGKDSNGRTVSSGVYFLSLRYQNQTVSTKMVFVK